MVLSHKNNHFSNKQPISFQIMCLKTSFEADPNTPSSIHATLLVSKPLNQFRSD